MYVTQWYKLTHYKHRYDCRLPTLHCYWRDKSFFKQVHVLQQHVLQDTDPWNTFLITSAYSFSLLLNLLLHYCWSTITSFWCCQNNLLYSLILPHRFKKNSCSSLNLYFVDLRFPYYSYKKRQYSVSWRTCLSNKKLRSSNRCPFYRVTEHCFLIIQKSVFSRDLPLLQHKYVGHVAVFAKQKKCYCEVVDRHLCFSRYCSIV